MSNNPNYVVKRGVILLSSCQKTIKINWKLIFQWILASSELIWTVRTYVSYAKGFVYPSTRLWKHYTCASGEYVHGQMIIIIHAADTKVYNCNRSIINYTLGLELRLDADVRWCSHSPPTAVNHCEHVTHMGFVTMCCTGIWNMCTECSNVLSCNKVSKTQKMSKNLSFFNFFPLRIKLPCSEMAPFSIAFRTDVLVKISNKFQPIFWDHIVWP